GGQGARSWDLRSGTLVHKQVGPSEATNSFALSHDASRAVSLDNQGQLLVWDTSYGKTIQSFPGYGNADLRVAFSHDGRWLVTAGSSRELKLWDLRSGMVKWTLPDRWANALAFSPDGTTLAGSGSGPEARLWDVETGNLVRTLSGARGGVVSVAFSPDGATLAGGDLVMGDRVQKGIHLFNKTVAGEVTLWDVRSGNLKHRLVGHDNGVVSVAFSPDGKFVASGCVYDYSARVWDVATGRPVRTFGIHDIGVNCVGFSPDGATLATIGSEGKIRLWDWKQERR
ncbi:WD40 repeat domain-containing protein, partial [Singulisphaera rosea]